VADDAAEQAAADGEVDAQPLGLGHHGRVRRHRDGAAARLGLQQHPRVRVARGGEDRGDRALLHRLAVLHHHHAVGVAADDLQVVGDEQHRHPLAPAQLRQEFEHLGLDGDVERRGRLVGDQQLGRVGQRRRDHHPLPLPAGELVRVGVQPLLHAREADLPQQLQHARPQRRALHALVQGYGLADLPPDRCAAG
jgi:hypothetical protein